MGASGLELYMVCYSNECLPGTNEEESGVIDRFGNITNQYDFYRYAFRRVKTIEKYIASAELVGVIMNGEYFDDAPSAEELRDNYDAKDIYKGKIPPYADFELKKYKELIGVESKYQVLVSCFENKGKRVFMAVNTSLISATRVNLMFDGEYGYEKIIHGKSIEGRGCVVEEISLPAGENFVVVLK